MINEDFHGWLLDQAAVLRTRDFEALDCEHLAEELELMAARERREMQSELKNLLLHLLKLKFEPGEVHRYNSWCNSIEEGVDPTVTLVANWWWSCQAACARAPKREQRVFAVGFPAHHSLSLTRLTATAVSTCWREVFV
jgi:hypothetical protein